MLDLEQLQILGQLIDNMEVLTEKVEKSFESKDGEEFAKSKKEILNIQQNITEMVSKS